MIASTLYVDVGGDHLDSLYAGNVTIQEAIQAALEWATFVVKEAQAGKVMRAVEVVVEPWPGQEVYMLSNDGTEQVDLLWRASRGEFLTDEWKEDCEESVKKVKSALLSKPSDTYGTAWWQGTVEPLATRVKELEEEGLGTDGIYYSLKKDQPQLDVGGPLPCRQCYLCNTTNATVRITVVPFGLGNRYESTCELQGHDRILVTSDLGWYDVYVSADQAVRGERVHRGYLHGGDFEIVRSAHSMTMRKAQQNERKGWCALQ